MTKTLTEDDMILINNYMKREPRTQVYTLCAIRELLEEGDLLLNPEYQRKYLQTEKEASRFVESIFLGCVIPEIQLFQEKDGTLEVLDGQQRITSLLNFLNNKYELIGLNQLPQLNGFTFKDLPKELQKKYKNYSLSSRIVKNDSDEEYKFFVFERLNTGSKQLTKQEIRNCIYRGALLNLAKELSEIDFVSNFFSEAKLTNNRYESTEFVLRLISICEEFPNIKGSASTQINNYLIKSYEFSDEKIEFLKTKFLSTIKLIIHYIGVNALKNNKNVLNKVNIEAVFINLYLYFNKPDIIMNADKIKEKLHELISENEDYKEWVVKSTDSRRVIIGKASLVNKVINDVITDPLQLDRKRNFYLNDKLLLWERENSKNRNGIKCALCNQSILDFKDAEVDHIIPWSKGGQTILENGQLVHSTCNRMKSNNY